MMLLEPLTDEQRKEARSFPDLSPPNDAVLVHMVGESENITYYYRDRAGQIYYETSAGRKFKREMELARRKRKERANVAASAQ